MAGGAGDLEGRDATRAVRQREPSARFERAAAAEAHEFRDGNLAAAIAAYRDLTAARDVSVRAEALVRLARCLRKQQQPQGATAPIVCSTSCATVVLNGTPAQARTYTIAKPSPSRALPPWPQISGSTGPS